MKTIPEFSNAVMKARERAWNISPYADVQSCVMQRSIWDSLTEDAAKALTLKNISSVSDLKDKRSICGIDVILTDDPVGVTWIIELNK